MKRKTEEVKKQGESEKCFQLNASGNNEWTKSVHHAADKSSHLILVPFFCDTN